MRELKLRSFFPAVHFVNHFLKKNERTNVFQVFQQFIKKRKKKLQEKEAQDVGNINKIKFEPSGNLVDQAFMQFNDNLVRNEDLENQIRNG